MSGGRVWTVVIIVGGGIRCGIGTAVIRSGLDSCCRPDGGCAWTEWLDCSVVVLISGGRPWGRKMCRSGGGRGGEYCSAAARLSFRRCRGSAEGGLTTSCCRWVSSWAVLADVPAVSTAAVVITLATSVNTLGSAEVAPPIDVTGWGKVARTFGDVFNLHDHDFL